MNENQMQLEVLQPEISSHIKQVTLEELKTWIADGKLQPTHQVRIKDLSWLEAQRIPKLQALFEAKKNSPAVQPNLIQNKSLSDTAVIPEQIRAEVVATAKKPSSFTSDFSTKNKSESSVKAKADNTSDKSKQNTVEPSIPFQLYEKKVLEKAKKSEAKAADEAKKHEQEIDNKAQVVEPETPKKSKKPEPKTKPPQVLAAPQKKSSFVKKALGFVVGAVFMGLLAFGGSYLWAYQLKTPVEVDEKNLPELARLEDKLTSDKLELRLKTAAKEQELKNNNQTGAAQQIDITQDIAKLDNQYNEQRKTVIENYRNKLADADFNTTFTFSFAVLLALFILINIFRSKTEQPELLQHSSKSPNLQTSDSAKIATVTTRNAKSETAENIHATKPADAHTTIPSDLSITEPPDKTEAQKEISETPDKAETTESEKARNCLLHREQVSKFVCAVCSNYFCDVCPQTIDEVENCCPFCKVACKPAEAKVIEETKTPDGGEATEKKSLLEIGKESKFVMHEYQDERSRKIGVIQAFFIALLFSASISIFWVYKITPYLESRGKEVAQNISPNDTQKSDKSDDPKNANSEGTANKSVSNTSSNTQANSNAKASSPDEDLCMDPETKKTFKCEEEKDEQLRNVLREHAKQVKSVENAQSQIKEKTTLILSLISPAAREELARQKQANAKPDPVLDARLERDKQQLIKVFLISFVSIFGLLLSTRFLGKN